MSLGAGAESIAGVRPRVEGKTRGRGREGIGDTAGSGFPARRDLAEPPPSAPPRPLTIDELLAPPPKTAPNATNDLNDEDLSTIEALRSNLLSPSQALY